MTLLEVMLAIGMFTTALIWSMTGIYSSIAANRAVSRELSGNLAINTQVEEVQAVINEASRAAASSNSGDLLSQHGAKAQTLVKYYGTKLAKVGSTAGDDGLAIGANGAVLPRVEIDNTLGALVYRFPVAAPGESARVDVQSSSSAGKLNMYDKGLGEMRIYLDETKIPTRKIQDLVSWGGIGGSPVEQATLVFDLDGDGKIAAHNGGVFTEYDLANPDKIGAGLKEAVIDVLVRYYNNAAHTQEISTVERRMFVAGSFENSSSLSEKTANP